MTWSLDDLTVGYSPLVTTKFNDDNIKQSRRYLLIMTLGPGREQIATLVLRSLKKKKVLCLDQYYGDKWISKDYEKPLWRLRNCIWSSKRTRSRRYLEGRSARGGSGIETSSRWDRKNVNEYDDTKENGVPETCSTKETDPTGRKGRSRRPVMESRNINSGTWKENLFRKDWRDWFSSYL